MLRELNIKNYALIENLLLEFSSGLNIFTGETGAGKSIIIEALGIILGDRTSSNIVRKGTSHTSVSAMFDITNSSAKKILDDQDIISSKDNIVIIRREINSSGKSKCYVNDKPVTLSFLGQLGNFLVDVHGQYEHQALIKPVNQLNLIDRYGDLHNSRKKVAELYNNWQKLLDEMNSLKTSQAEREHKIDLYKFQVNEIEDANLKLNEEEETEKLLPQLKNSEKLISLVSETYNLFISEENSVLDRLYKAERLISNVNSVSKNSLPYSSLIEEMISKIKDLGNELEKYQAKLEVDPEELDRLIERRDLILRFKRKYGQSIREIISYRDKIKTELEKLVNSEQNIEELEKKSNSIEKNLREKCEKLSFNRKKVADKLEKLVQKEIKELGMPKAKFRIKIITDYDANDRLKITSAGYDRTEFLFSANEGEDLKLLKEVVSGGEMSRTMLALKTVLGKNDDIPTMIFDEIDSGVSGPMGQVIGKKLSRLSNASQIFCITHLAQIGCFSQKHFQVDKQVKSGRTYTLVNVLDKKSRVEEIARMLSGGKVTTITREHARELIQHAK